MTEPRAQHDTTSIPDVVLDELRSAFAGVAPAQTSDTSDTSHSFRSPLPFAVESTGDLVDSFDDGDWTMDPADAASDHTSGGRRPNGRGKRPGRLRMSGKAPKLSRRQRRLATASSVASDSGVHAVRVIEPPFSAAGAVVTPRPTIVIGVDERPDAVYLDDGDESERSVREHNGSIIVLGGDLDSAGVFDAVSPPARSMDPRVRARRIAVKRAASRKRLIWAAVVAGVVLVVVGVLAVFGSSLFAVQEVDVVGNVYTDPADLQAIIDDISGDPVLLLDTLALERRLEALPWIERAIVTTDFPHRVTLDLRERLPLASFAGGDGKYRVIDRDGVVLAVLENQPIDYITIGGQAPDTDVGAFAGAPYADAAKLVSVLPAEIRSITMSLTVDSGTGDLGMVLVPELPVRIGNFRNIDTKLARLLQKMRDDGGLSGCVRIDVSTGEVSCTQA